MNKITNTYKFTPKKTLLHKICDLIPYTVVSVFVLLGGVLGHLHWNEPIFSVVGYMVSAMAFFAGLESK